MAGLRVDPRSPLDNLMVRRLCVRPLCGHYYRERDNLGAWKCKYHPGQLVGAVCADVHAKRGTYACCGQVCTSRGCTRCDHVSTPTRMHEESVAVDEDHIRIIAPHLLDDDNNNNTIPRYPGVVRCEETAEIAIFRYAPPRSRYAYGEVYDVATEPNYGGSVVHTSPIIIMARQTFT